MATKTRFPLVGVIVVGVLIAAVGVTYEKAKSDRWVTFDVRLGDGHSWAGGAKIAYKIGAKWQAVVLKPLPPGDNRQNTWKANKQIKPPVALALSATPDFQGIPVTVVIRGMHISPRPIRAVGPATAATAAFVSIP